MKKFLLVLSFTLFACTITFSQENNYKKEGSVFVQQANTSKEIVTPYTWKDTKGLEYPIFLHKYVKGEKEGTWTCYIKKISKNGNEYRYYLPNGPEIAKEILKELPQDYL